MGWLMTASPIGQPKLLGYGDESGMLDMRLFYTVPEAKAMLSSLGAEGTRVYTIIELIDYGFIVCLAYVMSRVFQFLTNRLGSPEKLQKLHWFAYGRGIVDILENTSILLAMHVFTGQNWVLGVAGILTLLKWLFLLLYLLAAVSAVIYKVCSLVKIKSRL